MNDLQAAKGLGVFSVALGLTQLVAPNWVGTTAGVGAYPTVTRVCGARELASGIGMLSGRKPATALWARLAGDVLDMGLLGVALFKSARRGRVALVLGAVLGVSLLDLIYARRLQGV